MHAWETSSHRENPVSYICRQRKIFGFASFYYYSIGMGALVLFGYYMRYLCSLLTVLRSGLPFFDMLRSCKYNGDDAMQPDSPCTSRGVSSIKNELRMNPSSFLLVYALILKNTISYYTIPCHTCTSSFARHHTVWQSQHQNQFFIICMDF